MTLDVQQARQRFMLMMGANTVLMLIAIGFAIGHFVYGVDWMLWAFLGFLGAGFAVQIWFVRGVARAGKGD